MSLKKKIYLKRSSFTSQQVSYLTHALISKQKIYSGKDKPETQIFLRVRISQLLCSHQGAIVAFRAGVLRFQEFSALLTSHPARFPPVCWLPGSISKAFRFSFY